MNIVIAVHHFPPRYIGGTELEATRLAAGLLERGHTVNVICIEPCRRHLAPAESPYRDEVYQGIPLRRLKSSAVPFSKMTRTEYDNPFVRDHLTEFLGLHRPEIFHLMGGYLLSASGLNVARELRIASVVTLMDFWFLCQRLWLLRSNGELCRPPTDPVDCVHCLGEERRSFRWPGKVAPRLARRLWGLRHKAVEQCRDRQGFLLESLNLANALICRSLFVRSVFIEGGIDPAGIRFLRQGSPFHDVVPTVQSSSRSNQLCLTFFGQIFWHKGVHVLIEAMRKIPRVPILCRIYGDLSAFPDYVRKVRRLAARDTRVKFEGLCHNGEELSQAMRNTDAVIFPSLWYENSPNVILEAFSHRVPVIASNLGGQAELVRHNINGLLFTPADPTCLAEQIQRLINDPGLLPRLREGIRPVTSTVSYTHLRAHET